MGDEKNTDTVNEFREKHPRCRYCMYSNGAKYCYAKRRISFIGEAKKCKCYKAEEYNKINLKNPY